MNINPFRRYHSEDSKEHNEARNYLVRYGNQLLESQQKLIMEIDETITQLEEGTRPSDALSQESMNGSIKLINKSFSVIQRVLEGSLAKTKETRLRQELEKCRQEVNSVQPLKSLPASIMKSPKEAQNELKTLKKGVEYRNERLQHIIGILQENRRNSQS
jgi:valyl-tRNA synthetase